MNWEAIKNIYIDVLIYKRKIEYLGDNKYRVYGHYGKHPETFGHWTRTYDNGKLIK